MHLTGHRNQPTITSCLCKAKGMGSSNLHCIALLVTPNAEVTLSDWPRTN